MSGIILYMLLNQRNFQRLDHVRLNQEDELREHNERRIRRLEEAMRQSGSAEPQAAMQLALQLREQQQRLGQSLERTSSLMQSQLAALSQRVSESQDGNPAKQVSIVTEGLLETRDRLQELELELAAQQDSKRKLLQRIELLEAHLQGIDPDFSHELLAEVSASPQRELCETASQFFLSNEKYEQIAEMMIRNADFADICRDLKVSRNEIELVEAMAFRRSA